eukprot:m.216117 g.216117  ORF g.216117 m.216117 type:complete len:154 (-) comp28169_c0_seq1:157-618(-)
MGCYGIGVSRLLATIAEVHHDDCGVAWPPNVAPYRVAIVVLNGGLSKRDPDTAHRLIKDGEELYDALDDGPLAGDVVIDTSDRSTGVKLADAALMGYPWCVVVGKRYDAEALEVKHRVVGAKGGHCNMEPMRVQDLVAHVVNVTQACGRENHA